MDSEPRTFVDADLRGARFDRCDLSGAVLRGVDVVGTDLDSPWLLQGGGPLLVNGVDVTAYVDGELDRRFPGRALRTATTPEGLREAWAAVERQWSATLERAATLPDGAVDERVDGEWSFAETLRHLVMATDTWLGRAVLERVEPYHRLGMPNADYALDGYDTSVFDQGPVAYDAVLAVRADRVAQVRAFLADVTEDGLAVGRTHPWSAEHTVPTGSCLRTILEEEWEHHRYAVRDLAVLASRG